MKKRVPGEGCAPLMALCATDLEDVAAARMYRPKYAGVVRDTQHVD